jgi:catechol 2,3-dioxygenase-like lactoylglutathione lyase family enzyme
MVGLIVEDMAASLEFYRNLGMDIPEGSNKEPFVQKKMESGVSIFWDTVFANRHDPERERPESGYRVMLEFFLEGKGLWTPSTRR